MHVITGQIRRAPFTKEGQNANGNWKMFAVDFSERYKDKDGQSQYTNYRAVFFAKESMLDWYNEAFQEGKVISVSAESLSVDVRDKDGKTYVTVNMNNPRLEFSQRVEGGQQQKKPQQPQQQQQQRQQPQQKQNFEDDIPF
ncbi:nucleic acid binding protein [Shigella phage Sd1]|uniref:Nucleic acid binding protein n=1 Tax=Shigella phage Sd1 TaxID=2024313 RepID=A0A291AYJ9_9CAUD|nr:nucleic acid binding protein [Shigella phage Sd1]ATE86084.1 nucleic acid binding protein [Shigella phage Sd1]